MNSPKCDEYDYIHFLIAAQSAFSTVDAAKTHPAGTDGPAHDAYTRLLQRTRSDPVASTGRGGEALWKEVRPCVERETGLMVIDDSTLDKPYARNMALVTRHWSGKHHRVVQGINLITAWSPVPNELGRYAHATLRCCGPITTLSRATSVARYGFHATSAFTTKPRMG